MNLTADKTLQTSLNELTTANPYCMTKKDFMMQVNKEDPCPICRGALISYPIEQSEPNDNPHTSTNEQMALIESTVRRCLKNNMHIFHKTCLDKWISQTPTCPYCRVRFQDYPVNMLNNTQIANTLLKSTLEISQEYKDVVVEFMNDYLRNNDNMAFYLFKNFNSIVNELKTLGKRVNAIKDSKWMKLVTYTENIIKLHSDPIQLMFSKYLNTSSKENKFKSLNLSIQNANISTTKMIQKTLSYLPKVMKGKEIPSN